MTEALFRRVSLRLVWREISVLDASVKPPHLSSRAVLAALLLVIQPSAMADTFGSGSNTFTVDFVTIGDAGNPANTNGYGAVPYAYRLGKFEVPQEAITKATLGGLSNVTAGAWSNNQPAANITWYEAAAFVNWLNTNSGHQAAYNLVLSNGAWSMLLWGSANAWTTGGTNLFRHKNAVYFLPSENEWYKAAYYNAAGSNFFRFPTASNFQPSPIKNGTNAGTVVFFQNFDQGPAATTNAGGLGPYGTMAQGGNVWEWMETGDDGTNNSASENRALRGGEWWGGDQYIDSSQRFSGEAPAFEGNGTGFRVASVATPPSQVILTVEKTTNMSGPWLFDREIFVGPATNANEFYRLKIRLVAP